MDGDSELTYRINLQELPQHPKPGFTGLQVALHIGLPVFVKPQTGKAMPRGSWVIAQMPDATLKVGLQNQGNEHMQISDFALYVPGKVQAVAQESGSSYVLAGQAREWLLKPNSPDKITADRLQLKANTDAGNVDTELALGKL
jgi:fimbrial chaperone protein